ncbi:Gamma-glutamyl cyclotransferase gliK [Paramyrothecium foliicola]|nr:Gamma-glutamyl cyclotransferase gliK [Paramyrothecium foliicola]
MASQDTPQVQERFQTCRMPGCGAAALRKVTDRWRQPAAQPPSWAAIPQTSPERLAQASEANADDTNIPHPKTYLYLAYGSNLAAHTFLGQRGIKPLSQVNVSVPTLRLTFSLPGLPYWEPCFANVDYRKLPKKPKLPDPTNPPKIPPIPPPHAERELEWDDGLIGVVYEVTEDDYNTIIRTEGGGSSYKEVIVPCLPLPPRFNVPEKPPIPELPRPFLARTLFAPYLPPNAELPDDPRKDKWWYRFVIGPRRPNPDYAQASARYLKLLNDGAREHELPDDYQRYMSSLQPYKVTSLRQLIGKFLFLATWGPIFLIFILFSTLAFPRQARGGKLPPWMMVVSTVLFNLIWMSYDNLFKPMFGDGERTEETKDKMKRLAWVKHPGTDEEKMGLLQPEGNEGD